jgi:hypothetical protein
MKSSIQLLFLVCGLAILPLNLTASVNETNNTPGYVMYVLVGHNIYCPLYSYSTDFTCDHYLTYAVPYGQSVVFNDHPEGGECYHTYWVANITWIPVSGGATLTKASSQAYSGTDIFPNICTNSQSAYKQARWKVSLASGVTATLSATGGVSLSKTSNIVNNDVITVTAGSSTGTYNLSLTPSSGAAVGASGTVFKLGFAQTVQSDYAPSGSTNGAAYSGPGFSVNVNQIPLHVSGGKSANVSRNFAVKVVTTPANAFSGNVNAAMRIQTNYTPNGRLHKNLNDGGWTQSLSVSASVGWVSFSIGGGGSSNVAAIRHGGQVTIAGGNATSYGEETWSTSDMSVYFPQLSEQQQFGGSAISRQQDDNERTYTVGSTEVAVRTEVAMSANTTTNSAYVTYVMQADSSGVGMNTFSEVNEEYVIQ